MMFSVAKKDDRDSTKSSTFFPDSSNSLLITWEGGMTSTQCLILCAKQAPREEGQRHTHLKLY